MNMAKECITTLPKWKRGTVQNGVQIFWLTVAGVLKARRHLASIRGKKDEVMFNDEFICG
jgi:hypothetical protein